MSAPHMNRVRGRPAAVEKMNILVDEIEDVAELVKLRMLGRGGAWEVYADENGSVFMENQTSPFRRQPMPDSWLVGTYTVKTRCDDIEDDLCIRRKELRMAA